MESLLAYLYENIEAFPKNATAEAAAQGLVTGKTSAASKEAVKWGSPAAQAKATQMGLVIPPGFEGSHKTNKGIILADLDRLMAATGGTNTVVPKATPATKKFVAESGVSWADITGTGVGPGGKNGDWRIEDVKTALRQLGIPTEVKGKKKMTPEDAAFEFDDWQPQD